MTQDEKYLQALLGNRKMWSYGQMHGMLGQRNKPPRSAGGVTILNSLVKHAMVAYFRSYRARSAITTPYFLYYLKSEFNHANLSNITERKMCVDWLIDQGDDRAAKALLATLKWYKNRTTPNDYQQTMIEQLSTFLSQTHRIRYVRADGTCRVVWRGVTRQRANEAVPLCRDLGIACVTEGFYAYTCFMVEAVIPEKDPLEKSASRLDNKTTAT